MCSIDALALRAENEDEADIVGCYSLRCQHDTPEPPNYDIFDFLGKDLIRYYIKVAAVFKNVKILERDKKDSDGLFDRFNVSVLDALFCAVYTNV